MAVLMVLYLELSMVTSKALSMVRYLEKPMVVLMATYLELSMVMLKALSMV